MLGKKTTKTQRQRGNSSHGWGHKKKHRGAGHRGGKGLSGTGARGDAKKPSVLNNSSKLKQLIAAQKGVKASSVVLGKAYYAKRGFNSKSKIIAKTFSLRFLEENFDKMKSQGLIVEEKGENIFDTVILGYDKVLGKSPISHKITLICGTISASAKARVEEAGGKVIVSEEKDDFSNEE